MRRVVAAAVFEGGGDGAHTRTTASPAKRQRTGYSEAAAAKARKPSGTPAAIQGGEAYERSKDRRPGHVALQHDVRRGDKPMGVQRRDAAGRRRPRGSPTRSGGAERERRVLAIRDRLLPLVRSKGQKRQYGCAGVAGPCRLTTWEDGPFRFVLREPYRPLAQAGWSGDAPDTWAMAPRVPDAIVASAPAPFGLDVWRGGGVVLSIGWVPDGPVEVVALQHGAWKDEALALG
jgi:hypothetical protein